MIFGSFTICSTFVRSRLNGAIWAFGLNNYNQLGITKKNSETVFAPQLTPFKNVKHITGNVEHRPRTRLK